jgi:diguanylate cyclase (GGDEF)-like protein/PAS domain S-box-containing protein
MAGPATHDRPHALLVIESDPARAAVIRDVLVQSNALPFTLEWAAGLPAAIEQLRSHRIGGIVLDLASVGEDGGSGCLARRRDAASGVPILVINPVTPAHAGPGVARGAPGDVLRAPFDGPWLVRTLRAMVERTGAEPLMSVENERAEVTLDSIGDAVLSSDLGGHVTYLNPAGETITGWSRAEATGRPVTDVLRVIDGTTRQAAPDPMALAMKKNQAVRLRPNSRVIRRDGSETAIEDSAAPILDREGRVTGAVIVLHDASASRARALEMAYAAQHDVLTDLPNRTLLNDRAAQAIASARRRRSALAVVVLDVDRFKQVNDSLGHALGDQLLQSIARRLVMCVRSSDTVSRQGGDEFIVLLSELGQAADAAATAQKILAAFATPFRIGDQDVGVTASLGVSLYPDDGQDAETLINSADYAMYQAKGAGDNTCQFFEPDMNVRAVERRSIEGGLRGALARKEFTLHYQPKVNLESGAIVGAEALIRWTRPDRGLVPPQEFVPAAEECGLVVPIGQWVLREACRQARAWQDAGLEAIPVAVNISAVEFGSKDFLAGLLQILDETGLDPRYLELELTETVLMKDAESTVAVLQALKEKGVRVAIDDFGTGYSSLSCLRQSPIEVLKIDRSFVREITADLDGAPIVTAVISLGKELERRVIAEGIETAEQVAFLQAHHCAEGQGYFFSPPVSAAQFSALILKGLSKPILH